MIIQVPVSSTEQNSVVLSWLLCGFFNHVCESFNHNARTRDKAYVLSQTTADQAYTDKQLTKGELDALKAKLSNIYLTVVPE